MHRPGGENSMNNTHRFDGKGEIYEKARPGYAPALFAYLKDTLHIAAGSVFADIGAGTGIFTKQLLDCGYRVFAVEPNGDMRKKAEEKLRQSSRFVSIDGSDSHTGLPDHSIDCITAAQAFHWFAPEAFRRECLRVLKPGGRVMLVYNRRVETADCTKALAELQYRYIPAFHGFSDGTGEEKCMAFFSGKCDLFRADNSGVYDRQGYTDRALSSSYALREGDREYAAYLQGIRDIFDRFSTDGLLTVPTETVAYIGTLS